MCPFWGRRYYKWMLRANWMFQEKVREDRQAVLALLSSDDSLRQLADALGMLGGDTAGFGDYLDTLPQESRDQIVNSVAASVEDENDVFFDWAFASEPQIEVNVVDATDEQSSAVVVVVRAPFGVAAVQ
jgi:hypothetical protein